MKKEKVDSKRTMVRREYCDVYTRLTRIFSIPDDELVLTFEWDKQAGRLILTTIKDE